MDVSGSFRAFGRILEMFYRDIIPPTCFFSTLRSQSAPICIFDREFLPSLARDLDISGALSRLPYLLLQLWLQNYIRVDPNSIDPNTSGFHPLWGILDTLSKVP